MSKRDFTGFGFKMQFGWSLKSFLEKTRIRVNMMIFRRPGDGRRQCISNHVIDPTNEGYPTPRKRLTFSFWASFLTHVHNGVQSATLLMHKEWIWATCFKPFSQNHQVLFSNDIILVIMYLIITLMIDSWAIWVEQRIWLIIFLKYRCV